MKFTMLFSIGQNTFHPKLRFSTCFERLPRKIRVSNIISIASYIIVPVFIEKEILNELNSTKVKMFICKD